MDERDFIEANRRHWDEAVAHHVGGSFYDVESFKRGDTRLHDIEVAALGDVEGRSLLHLQCHFGLDTLDWARRGAHVTGVDFAPAAITAARGLAAELDLDARFIEANVYDLPEVLDDRFDIVFTSYGALHWLPDVVRWARIAASYVAEGGRLLLVEFHPMAYVFDDEAEDGFRVRYPYFGAAEPITNEWHGTYATDAALRNRRTYEWPFGLGDLITTIAAAGLGITELREYPFSVTRQFPFLERNEDRYWHIPARLTPIPLMFPLLAHRSDRGVGI